MAENDHGLSLVAELVHRLHEELEQAQIAKDEAKAAFKASELRLYDLQNEMMVAHGLLTAVAEGRESVSGTVDDMRSWVLHRRTNAS